MNRTLQILFAAAAVLATPFACAAERPDAVLEWSCARSGAPTHAEIATTFGFKTFYQAQQTRLHVNQLVKRACQRDVDLVLVVVREPRQAGRFAVAAR